MNLTSTSDFVLENNENCVQGKSLLDTDWRKECEIQYKKNVNHSRFVKQPLEKWMFVPCDENGELFSEFQIEMLNSEDEIPELRSAYQQAKERCLFKGFKYQNNICISNDDIDIYFDSDDIKVYNGFEKHYTVKTIEDLIKYNLELTPTAEKQIGL